MSAVITKITPIHDRIMVSDLSFDAQTTSGGIIINSDDGKSEGIRPRWARVWAIGASQHDIKLGEWILVEHGRWTRGIAAVDTDGTDITIRMVDNTAILAVCDYRPNDINIGLSNASTTQEYDFSQPMF